jgi:hypothetical protein
MTYCKYYPDSLIDIILHNDEIRLRVSQPSTFHDKNDCNLPLSEDNPVRKSFVKALEEKEGKLIIKEHFKEFLTLDNGEADFKKIANLMPDEYKEDEEEYRNFKYSTINDCFGALCLTKNKKSTFLWEEYASKNSGFMVRINLNELKISKPFENESLIKKVKYNKKLPLQKTLNLRNLYDDLLEKHTSYHKEEEHRLIALLEELKKFGKDSNDMDVYCITLPYRYVEAIYIGRNANEELKTKILEKIKCFHHIKVFQAKQSKSLSYKLIRRTSDTPSI